MAKVTPTEAPVVGMLYDALHLCGEGIQVEYTSQRVLRYRDMFGSVITYCQHCGAKIEWEDVYDI